MTGFFWIGMFLLSVAAGIVSLVYLIFLMRKQKPTEGAKNLACTFLLLLVISSVGVTAHADDKNGAWDNVAGQEGQAELVDFEQMYHEFLSNELRAEEHYRDNRYLMAATIVDFSGGDPLAADGDIQVTMEVELSGENVPLFCGFSSEHLETLMGYDVGDLVIFEGTCQKAWEWTDCEIPVLS